MDRDTRLTAYSRLFHLSFEATDAGLGRVIVLEEDPQSGCKQVHDIIEFDPNARHYIHKVMSVLETPVLGDVVSIRAQWPADFGRCHLDASRVRRVIKAFPGASAYLAEMETLYQAPRGDDVPFGAEEPVSRLEKITDQVLAIIADKFVEGVDDELMLNCPLRDDTTYDIWPEGDGNGFYVVYGEDARDNDVTSNFIPTVEEAKRRIARDIAETLLASQAQVRAAAALGIGPL